MLLFMMMVIIIMMIAVEVMVKGIFLNLLTYAVVEVGSFLHLALNLAPGIYIQIHNSGVVWFYAKVPGLTSENMIYDDDNTWGVSPCR